MVKLTLNKGFTLVELLVTIVVISILTLIYLPYANFQYEDNLYTFYNSYLETQSKAIRYSEKMSMEEDDTIVFSPNGNVNQAKTIYFEQSSIVIELGGGRLVQR